ncbi:DNA-directed RNA polymerase subunit alpha [Bacteroidales bacterium OttesenSCG-928-B11]|nr:DNA-directed RNA polymerase subunit alpha [Bacteroidales bacterium OttesenSCG-928-C03]MDL2312315.1 DNA-directed RNA polymerase subunit alpha [Bacteroidales bacterium OttesenSCG-928-B11]MDL2326446.1 DNA-directed RNA polymerase subunit alpha [Bacteroidales bacterium OttesenSCG-928-A14]
MAILTFQKPEKVIMNEASDFHGRFEFRPLQQGYGITIGNALRRVLLSSLEGYAITSVKIEGVSQEFSSIEGVIEDVTDIILNLKQIRFKSKIENTSEKATIIINEQKTFTAGDINKYLNFFQVLNPELLICRMEPSVKLVIDITIDKGRGYVPAEDNKTLHDGINVIAIDSIHTPIKNVQFNVENYRVEQKTDFEKLVLDITTDGSVHPKEALKEAAKILIQHFALFSDEKISVDVQESEEVNEEFDEAALMLRQILKSRLADMDLSVRALNCLKSAELETLGDLVAIQKSDLLKFRNFGKKSLAELEDLVKTKGLDFGMNVAKYKLDKD